ncbi:DNA polymerase III subunit beta [Candidatus Campbellbacteria bacterium RIFCSPLOWO2_02_FULL_35_11]|uniref:Beta sliding clamp n=2 Tax=Candidatus Campbelliibacteriota TaxID=1752727 RepID=A0A1F5ENM7_9BACT|nr:MAG: DNA polymerase III subunit beta [Candidatus Campbellbacteria bacterium RIFCSPHIGHO2_12_FULL_35_10]OGD70558.1 MAG: DNA polymerase III subunit beta [Candidatus Campbellbacteria bacterium RIFCSPLOWO2_02_FULL_35_11]
MKAEILKEKLVKAISKADKITGKNLSLPVLGCVLLDAKKNNLKITSTNLDLGIEINISANVEEEGIVAVSGAVLNNLLSSDFRSEKIRLEKRGDNLVVLSDANSTTIKSQASDDFPTIPRLNKEKGVSIESKKLVKGLKSVWYSSATSNIKPELSSVLVYTDSNSLIFTATDSFRLAEARFDFDGQDFEQILIPFKNVPEILRVFDDIDDNITIYFTRNQIAFEYNNIYLTSRVIDGNFPDYKQLLPKDFKTEATVLKDDLMNTLKVSNIFSDKFNKVNFSISPKSKKFEVRAMNSDVGENINKVEAVLDGEDIEISFNQKYIMDCFQSIDSDSLVLKFNGLNKPMVIKSVPDSRFTYLVMPMNK